MAGRDGDSPRPRVQTVGDAESEKAESSEELRAANLPEEQKDAKMTSVKSSGS